MKESGPLEHRTSSNSPQTMTRYSSVRSEYKLSVLLMFHPNDVTRVAIGLKGMDWTYSKLEIKTLKLDRRVVVESMYEDICAKVLAGRGDNVNRKRAEIVLEHALEWQDHDMWNKVFPLLQSKTPLPAINKALDRFDLSQIRPGYVVCCAAYA